ncbi:MAG: excinuclease ABC subunit UvrC [archaeon]
MDITLIPHSPGCYLFKDINNRIIYIGKAKNLKKRVASYFQKKGHDTKTQVLVSQIYDADFIVTTNEKEALLLENNLIKKHFPKYNIILKDSKKYAYILLTKEEYPRLLVARNMEEKGDYFGPFTSAEKRDIVLKFANDVFRIRTCRKLPKRACLRYHMKLCDAPCINKITEIDYQKLVDDAKTLLSGRDKELQRQLKARMDEYSINQDYEIAKNIRDQIFSLQSLSERQNVETQKTYDQDIINFVRNKEDVHLAVFNVNKGVLFGKSEYDFEYYDGFLEEFISQYYSEEKIPKEIIIPEKVSPAMQEYLSELNGSKVRVRVPFKGEKLQLLMLVKKNLEKSYMEDELALLDLQQKLNLPVLPKIIECFDISHLSGTDSVGSMVRFTDGKPDKSNYRRFRIKTVQGIDDFAMIAEVVRRRYLRLIQENKEMPDLIIVDGGKGQLSSAMHELSKLSIKIPTISLAKRNEEVYFPGLDGPKSYDRKSRVLLMLQRIRDEAHRFAITYQKLLRRKRILEEK